MVEDNRLMKFYVYRLTDRQREIVECVAQGLTNREIGTKLYIEPSVVAGHLTNIFGELGTLDELEHVKPNRYILIRLFAPFLDRHPELRREDRAS
ncbi:MAG: helix-turn-helix transcriptional regulator [Anaerolineae bacterium]|nr:helix-turn-helix transcriptional regulator [Anaerolineae bacterium]